MALPINVRELIESRVVESTRIEYNFSKLQQDHLTRSKPF